MREGASDIEDNQQLDGLLHWSQYIAKHPAYYVPPPERTIDCLSYHINFEKVEGISGRANKKQMLQITVSVVGSGGNTYFSQMHKIGAEDRQRTKECELGEEVTFYSLQDEAVVKVELWVLDVEKNKAGNEFISNRYSLGEAIIEADEAGQFVMELNSSSRDIVNPSSLQLPSSRSLRKEEASKEAVRLTGTVRVTKSPTSEELLPPCFIHPPNTFPTLIEQDGGPKNKTTANIEVHRIFIPKSSMKIVLQTIQARNKVQERASGKPTVSLKESRVVVEFHNGWKTVAQQVISMKEVNSSKVDPKRNTSMSNKATSSSRPPVFASSSIVLTSQGSKRISPVFDEGVIMIRLESRVEIRQGNILSTAEQSKSQTLWVPVGFAIIHARSNYNQDHLELRMLEGNPFCLHSLGAYITKTVQGWPSKDEPFTCQIGISVEGGQEPSSQTLPTNDIEELRAERDRLARLRRKLNEDKRKKMIELNQEIPLLQTTGLKEKYYESKLSQLRAEREEQEDILGYVRSKVAHLERQMMNYRYRDSKSDVNESEADFGSAPVAQYLPDNYQGYSPTEQLPDFGQTIEIEVLPTYFSTVMAQPISPCPYELIQSLPNHPISLSFKVKQFKAYIGDEFMLIGINCRGQAQSVQIEPCKGESHTSQILLLVEEKGDEKQTDSLLTQLVNCFYPLFLTCDKGQKIVALGWIDMSKVSQSKSHQVTTKISFRQGSVIVGQALVQVEFTSQFAQPIGSSVIKEVPVASSNSALQRIRRFKQTQSSVKDSQKSSIVKTVIMSKIGSRLQGFLRNGECKLELTFKNSSQVKQGYSVAIYDTDQQVMGMVESRVIPSSFVLEPGSQQGIEFINMTSRMTFPQDGVVGMGLSKDMLVAYNHKHSVEIRIIESRCQTVEAIYTVDIYPEHSAHQVPLIQFVGDERRLSMSLPRPEIATSHPDNVKISPTRTIIHSPQSTSAHPSLLTLSIYHLSDPNIQMQNFAMQLCDCVQVNLEGRLFTKVTTLLKVPFDKILSQQQDLPYLIEGLKVWSRSVIVTLGGSKGAYYWQCGVKRGAGQMWIRAQVELKEVGRHIYGVQIADQYSRVFHRIGIECNVSYPSISPEHMIKFQAPAPVKISQEQIVFSNPVPRYEQYRVWSYKGELVSVDQGEKGLREDEDWTINLEIDWPRMGQHMGKQRSLETVVLLGVTGFNFVRYYQLRLSISQPVPKFE